MIWVSSILIALLILLFLLPIELEVDSKRAIYRLQWQGILGMKMVPEDERLRWYFNLLFFEKEIHPKLPARKPKAVSEKRSKSKLKRTMPLSPKKMFLLLKNMLNAVSIKRFEINWDTDDVIQNAYLTPVFFHLSKGSRKLRINFIGQQELAVYLHTSLWRLARAALRTFII